MWILTDALEAEDQRFINMDQKIGIEFVSKEHYLGIWSGEQEVTREEAEEDLASDNAETLYFCAVDSKSGYDIIEILQGGDNQKLKVAAIHKAVRNGLLSGATLVDLGDVLAGL